MPNWTSNRIEAPAEVLKKYISKDENGKEYFDFNLVIPRPKVYDDPDLVAGGHEEVAIKWYKSSRGLKPHSEDFTEVEDRYGDLEKLYQIGKKYVEAKAKFGHYDWYGWSSVNWGTKWNACNSCVDWVDDGWVEFETAWCVPMPIIEKIMKDNPDCEIRIIWRDEDYDGTHTYEHDGHGRYREYTVYEKQYEEEDEEE